MNQRDVFAIRLSEEERKHLDLLAEMLKLSRGATLRLLLAQASAMVWLERTLGKDLEEGAI